MKRKNTVKNRSNTVWILILVLILVVCFASPIFCVFNPTDVDLYNVLQPPNTQHIFGTDSIGRDILSRVLHGGIVSLLVAAITTAVGLMIGLIYGGISGYVGGKADSVMMRFIDVVYSIPTTIIVLAFQMIFPNKVLGLVIIMSLTSWMTMARVIRGRVMELKESNFIILAHGFNIPQRVIIFNHMIRNSFSSIIIIATFTFSSAIVTETAMSYLGVGIPIGIPSWGNMIMNAQNYILTGKWWIVLFPGIFIIVSSLCINFTGEYLKNKYIVR